MTLMLNGTHFYFIHFYVQDQLNAKMNSLIHHSKTTFLDDNFQERERHFPLISKTLCYATAKDLLARMSSLRRQFQIDFQTKWVNSTYLTIFALQFKAL
jgi:hypothetical protein